MSCESFAVCVRKRALGLTGFVSSFINHTVPLPSHTLLSVSLLLSSRSLGYITAWRMSKYAEALLTSAKRLSPHIQKDAGLFSLPETNTLCFSPLLWLLFWQSEMHIWQDELIISCPLHQTAISTYQTAKRGN